MILSLCMVFLILIIFGICLSAVSGLIDRLEKEEIEIEERNNHYRRDEKYD